MKAILMIAALGLAVPATAAPIDECTRVMRHTHAGSCGHKHPATRSAEKSRNQPRPEKPTHPTKPDNPGKPDKDRPNKPDHDHGKRGHDKGNASANNGKGGNYDRTGHHDNGKGHGRDHK